MTRPGSEPSYQAERLREAADHLGSDRSSWSVTMPVWVPSQDDEWREEAVMQLPGAMCRPLRNVLREAAERIEVSGRTLGQPVNYALEIAGVILGEDLGHNR